MKFSLHDLKNVNTVLGMLYDKDGNYRPGFSPEEFYDTILLDSLKYGEENYVHLKYAETVNIKKGAKVARFRRWAGMTPTLRPLLEGFPPAPDKHAYEYIEVGNVYSFGRWSEYTDQIDMSVISEIVAERSVQYGENANQTKELYARKTWLSSPNEFYANFKGGFADLQFGDAITIDDLRFLTARMKRMQVKPVSGKFNYICSQEFINGLIDDPRVKMYMEINNTTGNLWTSGECFPLFDLNFIPTMLDEFAYPDTEFPGVYEDSTGKEIIRLYAVKDSTIYYLDVHQDFVVDTTNNITAKSTGAEVEYLSDGTAVEYPTKWEVPTNTETFTTSNADIVEASSSKVRIGAATISHTTDSYGVKHTVFTPVTITTTGQDANVSTYLTAINGLIDDGAFMQLPVHRGILFGDEAMIKLNYEGLSDAPRIIVKPVGSSGVLDPLNQRQSIGYRVDGFGLAIKRPEAICITYGIPVNAEFAALTTAYMVGHPVLLDNSTNASTDVNSFVAATSTKDAYQKMEVAAVNQYNDVVVNAPNRLLKDYPAFSTSSSYEPGDLVVYTDGKVYVFTKKHDAGAWDAKHVVEVKGLYTNLLDTANDKTSNVK